MMVESNSSRGVHFLFSLSANMFLFATGSSFLSLRA
jgi:hypothetical protein